MGDHTEAIEVDFDPNVLSYEQILSEFWRGHRPIRPAYSVQYRSAVFYQSEEQRESAEKMFELFSAEYKTPLHTAIEAADTFYLAEEYHQKYTLQAHRKLMRGLRNSYPDFIDLIHSTAAARLNGYISGYGDLATFERELPLLGLDQNQQQALKTQFARYQ